MPVSTSDPILCSSSRSHRTHIHLVVLRCVGGIFLAVCARRVCYPLCVTTNFTNSISSDSEIGNMAIPAYSIKEVISSILNVNTILYVYVSHSDSVSCSKQQGEREMGESEREESAEEKVISIFLFRPRRSE